jgi:hypothetical protein
MSGRTLRETGYHVNNGRVTFRLGTGSILQMRLAVLTVLSLPLLCGQTCAPTPAMPDGVISGSLDNSSCQLSDATAYAAYRLDLPARGKISVALTTTQDFLLLLRDSSGAKLDSGASIQRPIEAGSYTLLVNARIPGQVGDYSVKTSFTADAGTWCAAFPALGVSQTVKGKLGASGCAMPDGTAYEGYWLTTLGAGTLTIAVTSPDFTPMVYIRTPDRAAAASGSGTATASVDADTRYQIVVSTSDNTGAYEIAASFQPDRLDTCKAVKTLTGAAKDSGPITGDSCALTIPGSGDLQYYNYYTLQVDSAGIADLAVASADFQPTLYLLDAAGNTLAGDTGGGATGGSQIRMHLQPGAYTLQIQSSVLSGGSYQLDYQFTAGQPRPCAAGVLEPNNGQSGTIGGSSCRTEFGAADLYTIALPTAGTLDLTLTTDPALLGAVAIRDLKDNLILTTRDIQGLGIAQLTADLPAGSYTVAATSAGGAGAYRITDKFTAHDLAGCGYVQAVDSNGGYIKRLSSFSCRGANGAPVDLFEFTLPADGTAAMVVTSSEMDSYLTLTDPAGSVLRTDDNSYGYGDPLIIQHLATGTYRLAVRSASGSAGGLYQVDVRSALGQRPAFCAALSTVPVGGSISGTIGFSGCQLPDGAFADMYRIDVTSSGAIDINLKSSDFDAYLLLLDAKGNLVAQDDDSGGGTNARVAMLLAPGSYYVVARPSTDYTAAGAYSLSVQ